MKRYYAAVYYCGDDDPPAFHLIDEGEISKGIFKKRLKPLTELVRKTFMFGDESIDDYKIQENIYFFKYDDLMPARALLFPRRGRPLGRPEKNGRRS